MSSTTIEKEVVQMVFDGKGFGKGVQTSIDQVGDLKKALDFTGADAGLEELNKASRVDFSAMTKSLDSISSKLSITGVAAAAFVSRVTNAVLDGAKKLAEVLLFTPIKDGLGEFETQMDSIQTILSNTKKHGTNLDDVTTALDELNLYADLTIYNFGQMTQAIGKFTAAGVELEPSVAAIKGLSNLAAVSGANAEEAGRAYYQMSQAIASGVVRLQDWISVENAGMGGALFQDALIETARVHGVHIDQILEQAGGFRSSLQEKWLTSDIMLETLQKFTGDLTEAQLEQMGYTEEQIAGILELGQTANDAATKVKTLSQLKDVMIEALGTGWADSFKIIFGNFDQAVELFTDMGDYFGAFIEQSSASRNALLSIWANAGGRRAAIKAFYNAMEGIRNVLVAVGKGVTAVFKPLQAIDLIRVTRVIRELSEKFKMASENLEPFQTVVQAAASVIDILFMAIKAILAPFGRLIAEYLPSASSSIGDFILKISEGIIEFHAMAEETDFFNGIVDSVIAKFGEWFDRIGKIIDRLKEFGIVQDIIKLLSGVTNTDVSSGFSALGTVVAAVTTPFYILGAALGELYDWFIKLEVVSNFVDQIKSVSWDEIKEAFAGMGSGISEFIEGVKNDELVGKLMAYLNTFDGRRLREFFAEAKSAFGWVSGIVEKITGQMGGLDKKTQDVGGSMGGVGETVKEGLGQVLDFLTENAKNIDYSAIFDVITKIINLGLFAGIVGALKNIASGGFLQSALEGVFGGNVSGITKSITGVFGSLEDTLGTFQNNIKADTLQKIAISIAVLAGSLILLSLVDSTKLLAASAAIVTMTVALFGSAGALSVINTTDAAKGAVAIIGISIALLIATQALKQIQDLDGADIELTMAAMAAALVSLVVAVNAMSSNDTKLIKTALLLIILAGSLYLMSDVIAKFSNMNPENVAQGLGAVALTLGLLTGTLLLMGKIGTAQIAKVSGALYGIAAAIIVIAQAVQIFGNMELGVIVQGLETVGFIMAGFAAFTQLVKPQGMLGAAIGMVVMTGALIVMSQAVRTFGNMDWDTITRGLVAMGGALLILVLAANLMSGALAGAAAMLIMSVAITGVAVALKLLGSLSWDELGIALAGLAATFVILGLAGLILAPIVPVLLLLGVAMLLMGLAAVTLGVGLLAASAGLLAIAGSAALIGAGIATVATAAAEALPALAESFALALIGVLQIFAEKQPEIIEAMKTIILGLIEATLSLIPDIVAVMGDMILALLDEINSRLPELIQAGYDILLAFLQGIADNIADIIETGLRIVTEIINGIAEGLPDLVDSAFNLILTFLDAIADAIEEYMPQILEAGARIGIALVEGLINGLWDTIDLLKEAIGRLVQEAIDRFKADWGITSPSKVTQNMGWQIMLGFAKGILEKIRVVKDAFGRFSDQAQDGIQSALAAVATEVENDSIFEPVIRPVMDLTNFNSSKNALNGALRSQSLRANLTYAGIQGNIALANSQDVVGVGANSSETVIFNQNNYSPKNIDPTTTFKNTKSLLARYENREL